MNIDNDYLIKIRCELDAIGVAYTEKHGKSSVVGVINDGKKGFTIGIRADMDALFVDEENDLPYKSKIKGQMHACGHDAHTAMLLTTARALNDMRNKLNCRVVLLFQPSEEGATLRSYVTATLSSSLNCHDVYNNPYISDLVLDSAAAVVGRENAGEFQRVMSSEDFSMYLIKNRAFYPYRDEKQGKWHCRNASHKRYYA